jgi:diguanylate cyclase (GGDEF)-like protein
MALSARRVKTIEAATAAAERLFGAETEQAVFSILSEICTTASDETQTAGYSVTLDGRAIRPMTRSGPLADRIRICDVERWLMGRGAPPSSLGAAEDLKVVWQRLVVDHRIVGGFVLAGPRLDEAGRRRCDLVACLAAGAIVGLRQRRSNEMRLRRREREFHALAFRDQLTGLPNRLHLTRDRLPRLLAGLESGEIPGCALFLVGLRDLGPMADIHGRAFGDHILESVAERLSRNSLRADAVLRLGEDEFGVLFERSLEKRVLAAIADRMIEWVNEPVRHGDRLFRPEASIGIAPIAAAGAAEIESMLGDAGLALQEARKQKASAFRFFEPSLRRAKIERLALVDDVRRALAACEFELHYQPQFSARNGRLVGFEALARWSHPTRGVVPPATFVPLMEEHGLIERFGEWVLRTACAEARCWPDDVIVAVNVSPSQVHGARFSLILADTLLRSGLSPHRLELEITESVFLVDEARTRAELARWKTLGVGIALDDFGCGYSSLGYLGVFPIDKIKIDRSFLHRFDPLRPEDDAGVLLRAIIDLGRALGVTVTAEGVETPAQLDHLCRNGCTEVQGFLLGRPMPAVRARRFLRDYAEDPASAPTRRQHAR